MYQEQEGQGALCARRWTEASFHSRAGGECHLFLAEGADALLCQKEERKDALFFSRSRRGKAPFSVRWSKMKVAFPYQEQEEVHGSLAPGCWRRGARRLCGPRRSGWCTFPVSKKRGRGSTGPCGEISPRSWQEREEEHLFWFVGKPMIIAL